MVAKKSPKYIFVAGGVMSGIGKGITASSIAKILQARGFKVTAMKIDPYVNVDAGTMNPTEHGEVFVLNDGMECDQDMGNYERFLNTDLPKLNYMTTGSIYTNVITRERNLKYGGRFVAVVPEIPLAVIRQIDSAVKKAKADFIVVEVGGTVGEYENILFLEAYRMLKIRDPKSALFVLVSFLPLQHEGELKTKPTQHAVRTVSGVGIHPDIIIARAKVSIDQKRKRKIAFSCSVEVEDVISTPDVKNIYEVPLNFERDGLGNRILKKFGLKERKPNLTAWKKYIAKTKASKKTIKIGIVGKYFNTGAFVLADSYISVIEAIKHAGVYSGVKPQIEWLSSEDFEKGSLKEIEKYHGIVIPGGFGDRGIEGKIRVIKHCRENKIPILGLCYGLQLQVIEFARNIVGLKGANTTEVDSKTKHPVIDILPEQKENLINARYGGSMRLGDYPANLKPRTIVAKAYGKKKVIERHRHRYEVNPEYISRIEKKGLVFSGSSPDRRLMEYVELPENKHPFFVGTQAHPEFLSRPLRPHPLFTGLIKAASKRRVKK